MVNLGERMKLIEVIENIDKFDESYTIYAITPWHENSECIVEYESDDGSLPDAAKSQQMDYLLEVFLVKEFLDGWIKDLSKPHSSKDICRRLVEYAINDA